MKDYGGNPEDVQHHAEVPELVFKCIWILHAQRYWDDRGA